MRKLLLSLIVITTINTHAASPVGGSYFQGKQIATPTSPASGFNDFYFKSDNKPYCVNSSGTETQLLLSSDRGNLTDAGTDGITVTGGTNSVLGSGTSLAQHVSDSTHNGYLSSTDWSTFNGKQAAGNYITALTSDVTAAGPGSAAATLATVNSNVGSFGSSTAIPSLTVNGKGLVTAASTNVVIAPAGTLTGTTLASNVVTSSLTTVGTIGTGVWHGTLIGALYGGTGGDSSSSTGLAHVSSGTWSYSSLVNADVSNSAAIAYAKLNLSNSIVNADVASNAAIATSKIALTAPTLQSFTSSSGTYTTPAGALYIKVKMVGGGGGGAGISTSTVNTGGTGGNTTFGSGLLVSNGGVGGSGGVRGGIGGTASLGSGPVGMALTGGTGYAAHPTQLSGGGASSPFGGAPGGVYISGAAQTGTDAVSNTGSGGAGAISTVVGGDGGGAGGYVDAIITSPSATYPYAVGAAGTAGSGSTAAGGAGGSGYIVVEEYYQ